MTNADYANMMAVLRRIEALLTQLVKQGSAQSS